MPRNDEERIHGHGFERANLCANAPDEEPHPLRNELGAYSMAWVERLMAMEPVCNDCKALLSPPLEDDYGASSKRARRRTR